MARASSKSAGTSRIRFVMLEAELEDGDFSQITQAIQNALGPQKIIQTQILRPPSSEAELLEHAQDSTIDVDDGTMEPVAPSGRPKSPSKRTFPTPEVVDVAWNVKPTIETYITDHPPKTVSDRFLVVLSWFKETGHQSGVTTNQVYTTFRKIKWPTAIKDFSQPLRDLKGQQLITGNAKDGFTINHLGAARVDEMKP